jgi:hypothetical protein
MLMFLDVLDELVQNFASLLASASLVEMGHASRYSELWSWRSDSANSGSLRPN